MDGTDQRLPGAPRNAGHAEWIAGRVKVLLSHYFLPEIGTDVEEAALGDWIDALIVFPEHAINHAVRSYLRDQPRRRPTPGDIRARAAEASKPQAAHGGTGDRSKLTHDDLALLDVVLATARRWVREVPGLAQHGATTLAHWGEPIPVPNVLPKSLDERQAAERGGGFRHVGEGFA